MTLLAHRRRWPCLAFALVVAAPPARAQQDTRPLFTGADALFAGGIVLGARLIHPLDERYRRRLQDSSTQASRRLQVLSKVFRTSAAPGAYILGGTLYAAGRFGKNDRLADLGLHGTEALVIGEVVATTIKTVVGRARPYLNEGPSSYGLGRGWGNGNYKSFPSGHTVAAFAAAAAVTSETSRYARNESWIVGPVLFGAAGLVGASRMYNNQHWASDIIVGAGIGTLAGLKVVRWHHAHPGGRLDRWFLAGSLVPAEDGSRTVRWSLVPRAMPPGTR